MAEISKRINSIKLIQGVLLYSLILSFFGGLGGHDVPLNIHAQSIIHSGGSHQNTFRGISDPGSSSIFKICTDSEVEEDVDDDHYSNTKSFLSLPLPLVCGEIRGIFLSPRKKIIKLFILFHSWKSFLLL
jgi:hypothetical protein